MSQQLRLTAILAPVLALVLPVALFAQDGWERRTERAHIRIGRSFTLPEGTTLRGPLLVIGGRVRLDGIVEDDVTAIGGNIEIGPTAHVRGDLHTVGGNVNIASGAQVTGNIEEVTAGWGDWDWGIGNAGQRFWAWLTAWLTVLRLSFVFVAGLLLAFAGPYWMRSIGSRVTTMPGWSLLSGVAAEVLVTPAVVALSIALIITIVGIPLLAAIPVLLGGLAIMWMAGFTAVAIRVGSALRGHAAAESPVAQFIIGFLVISGLTMASQVLLAFPWLTWVALPLGAIGLTIEYVAWTIGLGAALLTAFNRNGRLVPPPIPPGAAPQYAQ